MPNTIINASVTKALKNGAGAVNSDGIATGEGGGELAFSHEMVLVCPALATADLGDGDTMAYAVEHSDDDSTYVTLYPQIALQTGAGGAGAAAQTVRFRLPSDVKPYVRITATNSAAGDASDKSLTFKMLM